MRKCLRCSQGLTLGWAGGKTRNGPKRRLGRYKIATAAMSGGRWEQSKFLYLVCRCENQLLLHRHFIVGAFEDFLSTRPRICFGCSMP